MASSEKTGEEAVLVISGDDKNMGSGAADSDEAAASSSEGAISFLAKSMLWCGFLRPGFLSPLEEEAELALDFSESSSIGKVSLVSDEAVPKMESDLEPGPGGGLSDEKKDDFYRVFLEMFPDSASQSQGMDPNTPMENGLTILQWWLLEWLRDQVKHDEMQLAYLMGVEEEARQLNKVAIPPGAVEGSELMQSELMQVMIRAFG